MAQSELARRQAATNPHHAARRHRARRIHETVAVAGPPPAAVDAESRRRGSSGNGGSQLTMQPALQLALLLAILLPAVKIAASVCARFGIPAHFGRIAGRRGVRARPVQPTDLHLFQGGHATSTLLLLAQVGGLRVDVHRGHRNRHRAHARSERDGVHRGAVRCDLAFFAGRGSRASVRAFLDDLVLPGRRADGHERFDFRANADGRGQMASPKRPSFWARR